MPDALTKIQKGKDKARALLAKKKLGGRENDVILRSYTVVGANPDAGNPGVKTPVDVVLTPRPSVELKEIRGLGDVGIEVIGDAIVSGISRINYTKEQLSQAVDWIIDDEVYTLADGSLKIKPTEFTAVLRKRKK